MKRLLAILLITLSLDSCTIQKEPESGYRLWLAYTKVDCANSNLLSRISLAGTRFDEAIAKEFTIALPQLVGITPLFTSESEATLKMVLIKDETLGDEGYYINTNKEAITISAQGEAGLLYGTYHLLRAIQTGEKLASLDIKEVPAYRWRQLNHWDDLDGNIERGYAGETLWKWDQLPDTIDPRYEDYARANASIGINGVVLNNVNSDPRVLRSDYLEKISVLAKIFRKYNISVYLAANFAAPLKPSDTPDVMKKWGGVGNLDTANPKDPKVIEWWNKKAEEIYTLIPDFGGFLVKANSEGMPGPQDYDCTHADGANLLARALKPYGGQVLWRTFVYNPKIDKDRIKRCYLEFMPLDGEFEDNVILQTKNGGIDFQPIEPIQPLFFSMKKTQVMPELQITQEYIGHSTYLVYLLPMWKEFFKDYQMPDYPAAIAGVANTGTDENWTGHHFAQANWYLFGRLAWNPYLAGEKITSEWIRMTWSCDQKTEKSISEMMMPTWHNFLMSHDPYGLGLTTKSANHIEAGFESRANKEWHISKESVGSDRTATGSAFVQQYNDSLCQYFSDPKQCADIYMLLMHELPWDYMMRSGQTLREELTYNLTLGIQQVKKNIAIWQTLKGKVDSRRYEEVLARLHKEEEFAITYYESASAFFKQYTE